ncbi:DUF5677 domain-containing protein [Herbaspirillum robiniae]|uniref:DUF5677 domain-containing protein n=1 Tax=Herbaspirillum robiniae TaxID=2014887 RepID=UPI003D774417
MWSKHGSTLDANFLGKWVSFQCKSTLVALSLWQRSIRSCQASLLLSERGMIPEARVQIRAAYEMLFFAIAAIKSPSVVARMEQNDSKEIAKMASGMLASAGDYRYTDEQIKELQAAIDSADVVGASSKYTVVQAARDADMLHLFETVYRGMSLDAAHATLNSTDHFFEDDGEGGGRVVFAPDAKGIEFTMQMIATCLISGLEHFGSMATSQN